MDEDDGPVSWAADCIVSAIKKINGEDHEFMPRFEEYMDLAVGTLIPGGYTLLDAPRLPPVDEHTSLWSP